MGVIITKDQIWKALRELDIDEPYTTVREVCIGVSYVTVERFLTDENGDLKPVGGEIATETQRIPIRWGK